eukprot:scaffold113411_cov67-Phaeocystis_antarctica.AAC.2
MLAEVRGSQRRTSRGNLTKFVKRQLSSKVPGTLCQTRPSCLTRAPPTSVESASDTIVFVVYIGGNQRLLSISYSLRLRGYATNSLMLSYSDVFHFSRSSYHTVRRQIFNSSLPEAMSTFKT